ncbi:hypothetical protein MNB_SV-14-1034 [hydrothermal vent metagenome]|uniref:Uncharacterized protein n=1 Tax=hydrothermal vent metagenome TaxID=652676 RepID=A0A1W1CCP7_9ZZZZ
MRVLLTKHISVEASIVLNEAQIREISEKWNDDVEAFLENLCREMDNDEFDELAMEKIEVNWSNKKYLELKSKVKKGEKIATEIPSYFKYATDDTDDWDFCKDFFDFEQLDRLSKFADDENPKFEVNCVVYKNNYAYATNTRILIEEKANIATDVLVPKVFIEHMKNDNCKFKICNKELSIALDGEYFKNEAVNAIAYEGILIAKEDVTIPLVDVEVEGTLFADEYRLVHDTFFKTIKKEHYDLVIGAKMKYCSANEDKNIIYFSNDSRRIAVSCIVD